MNIALVGYGKMGKAIEQIAVERGHKIVLKMGSENQADLTAENLGKVDVAIEFTNPHAAFGNVSTCLRNGVPVVCGSTGWLTDLPTAKALAIAEQLGFIYASNFSVGVNIFFELNRKLAQVMSKQAQYDVQVQEIHHTQKVDAPSGTAVTIAEGILENYSGKEKWVNHSTKAINELGIESIRQDPAPGTHTVSYNCSIDSIEIKHTAHNRIGFASGAVLAAEFLQGKAGVYSMKDVLGL
jgi:4-hydroxy-tetrahydrodipicolinate reductase